MPRGLQAHAGQDISGDPPGAACFLCGGGEEGLHRAAGRHGSAGISIRAAGQEGCRGAARLPELAGAALAADGAGAAAVGAGFLAGAPVLPVQACPVALRAGDAGAHRTLPEAPRPAAFVMGCPPYARGS
jgi:hypothetical protein